MPKPKKSSNLDDACPACGATVAGSGDFDSDSWSIFPAVSGKLRCYQEHQQCGNCGHKWDFALSPEIQRIVNEVERITKKHGPGKLIEAESILAFIRKEIPRMKIK
jgi:hypothetical protein